MKFISSRGITKLPRMPLLQASASPMMCVKHVNEALAAVKDVKKVEVSLSEGTAVITSTRQLSEDELKAAISAAGYGYEGLAA